MRKILLSVAVAMMAIVTTCNAQVFLGGSLSFSTIGGSYDNGTTKTDNPKTTTFGLNPNVGYFLSDNFAVGGKLSVSFTKGKNLTSGYDESTEPAFALTPYARYYFLNTGKFRIFGEADLSFGYSHETTKASGTTIDETKMTSISLSVSPSLSYSLTDKIDLEMNLNFLSFGFSSVSSKYETPGFDDQISKSNYFRLAAKNQLVGIDNNTPIVIGFIYKL